APGCRSDQGTSDDARLYAGGGARGPSVAGSVGGVLSRSQTGAPLRILVLTQHFWPEQFRINSFVEDLREAGAEVAVLTGQPNYPAGRILAGYRATGIGTERHPSGYDIYRVPLVPRGRSGAVRLVLNYLSFLTMASSAGLYLLRGRPFDVIFVYGT